MGGGGWRQMNRNSCDISTSSEGGSSLVPVVVAALCAVVGAYAQQHKGNQRIDALMCVTQ
jgi:hypothetical protein